MVLPSYVASAENEQTDRYNQYRSFALAMEGGEAMRFHVYIILLFIAAHDQGKAILSLLVTVDQVYINALEPAL